MMSKVTRTILIFSTVLLLLGLTLYFSQKNSEPTVTEVAPDVFLRQLQYHNANQTFVIFDNYVVVFDPGYVIEAKGLLESIRGRTNKPIKYVISSHFHPDHAAGASVFETEGAKVIASANGKLDYDIWARKLFMRRVKENAEGYAGLSYPNFNYIENPLVLDDGQMRMEVKRYGHGHTQGDLIAWLPKQGVLLMGDVANNGPLNLANANIAEWITVLKQLASLPIKIIIPGHGKLGGHKILEMNEYFLSQMLTEIARMVMRGMNFNEVLDVIEIPAYEKWAGVEINDNPTNVKRVFLEVGGTLH